MTDLTVLVSPTPLVPSTRGLFSKKTQFSTPIMVTLEAELDPSQREEFDSRPPRSPQADTGDFIGRSPRLSRMHRNYDHSLLSPPVNTWKAPRPRPRHRPTRSQSAPPERRTPVPEGEGADENRSQELPQDFGSGYRPRPPRRAITSFTAGSGGELVRPPPPLRECFHESVSFRANSSSTANNILEKDTQVRCLWSFVFTIYSPHSALDLYRCWSVVRRSDPRSQRSVC